MNRREVQRLLTDAAPFLRQYLDLCTSKASKLGGPTSADRCCTISASAFAGSNAASSKRASSKLVVKQQPLDLLSNVCADRCCNIPASAFVLVYLCASKASNELLLTNAATFLHQYLYLYTSKAG